MIASKPSTKFCLHASRTCFFLHVKFNKCLSATWQKFSSAQKTSCLSSEPPLPLSPPIAGPLKPFLVTFMAVHFFGILGVNHQLKKIHSVLAVEREISNWESLVKSEISQYLNSSLKTWPLQVQILSGVISEQKYSATHLGEQDVSLRGIQPSCPAAFPLLPPLILGLSGF